MSEDENDGNDNPQDQGNHRTEAMKVLEHYVQLLGTEEKFKMKPLVGLLNSFCRIQDNYDNKQLEDLFNQADHDEDDFATQHRQRVQTILDKAEENYPNNPGIANIREVVRRKSLRKHFIHTGCPTLKGSLQGIVDTGRNSTAKIQKQGSQPIQTSIGEEHGTTDYSGNELGQQHLKKLPTLETRGRTKKTGRPKKPTPRNLQGRTRIDMTKYIMRCCNRGIMELYEGIN